MVIDAGPEARAWLNEVGPLDLVEAFAVDPSDPSTVYVGTRDGVLVTTDFGRSWTRRQAGITR